jgi:hypothetical protein
VITVIAPSWVAFSTMNPSGTKADGLRACCMALILRETTPGRVQTSSEMSQSPDWAPIDSPITRHSRS